MREAKSSHSDGLRIRYHYVKSHRINKKGVFSKIVKRAKIKDRILKALINKECKTTDFEIGKYLNVPAVVVYTLMKEMETDGHIETIQTTSINSSTKECMCRFVLPEGHDFYLRTSYRWQSIKNWWREAPRNYWMIGTLFALLTSNAALITKLLSKEKQDTKQPVPPEASSSRSVPTTLPDSTVAPDSTKK